MAKYTPEFKKEVIESVNQIGYTETWKKYKGIVFPDTIKRWIEPNEAQKARDLAAKYHNDHKDNEEYKEKKRLISEQVRNSPEGKAYMEKYMAEHQEEIKANVVRHRQENLEHYLQRQKDWYYANKESANAYQKLDYQKNKKKYHKIELERYHNDPITKLKWLMRGRLNQLIKQKKTVKTQSIIKYVGCTIEELKLHLEQQFKSGMTWDNHGEWHIDHIKALDNFDLTDEAQKKIAFHHTNLQPLWKVENLQKSTKENFVLV